MSRTARRRKLKWVLTMLSALSLLAFIASFRVGVYWNRREDTFSVMGGVFHYDIEAWPISNPSWSIGTGGDWFASPYLFEVVYPPQWFVDTAVASVPLWIPLAPLFAATVILWRRDRRKPAGHCACGYNLTGNVSGVCPECGTTCAAHRGHPAHEIGAALATGQGHQQLL